MLDSMKVLAAGALVAVSLAVVTDAAGASTSGPKITVRPHSVMVNGTLTVKGKGFAPDATINLRECGRTFWLSPDYPCLESNATSVTTDGKGRFGTTMKAGLCPEGEATKQPTQRVCYVGQLVVGEDNGSLVGAAKILVSYP